MFKNKKPKPDQDRLGRQRQPRMGERGNAAVFSYHASRSARSGPTGRIDPLQQAPATAARNKRFSSLRRIPMVMVAALALVIVGLNSYAGGTPRVIVRPAVRGNDTVPLRPADNYAAAANEIVGSSLLNKNKLTINTARIAGDMRGRFPELARVDVSVPFIGASPAVHVTPATPELLLNANGELYIIDTNGRALMRANEVPAVEKLDLQVVIDHSGLGVTSGKPALPASDVAFITEVIGQLKAKGLTITEMVLPAGTSELDVRISGAGYRIKCNLQDNGRVEAGAFLAVKAQLEHQHIVPAEYIDVRVPDRAYYK